MSSIEGVRRRRVPAMAPEDRRAALITATIPLLRKHGLDVSTKQIAQAAGVAEGTIFGVFPDKNTLLVSALMEALDPRPALDAIAAIDPGLGLRERMSAAADLVHERFTENTELMSAAWKLAAATDGFTQARDRMFQSREKLLSALTALIGPDAAMLRRPPAASAALLLLFCSTHSRMPYEGLEQFDGAEMVSLLLDGLLIRTDHDNGGSERC